MSHAYAHLVVEAEPGKTFYLANDVEWDASGCVVDGEMSLSRNPPHQGGPFSSMEEAIDRMTGKLGNPGFIDTLSYEQFCASDLWFQEAVMENLNRSEGRKP